jgi:hypothetical protein
MAPHWYFGAQGRRACRRGFIPPCLPTKIVRPPSGEPWLHEIKHDGFRSPRSQGRQSHPAPQLRE